MDGGAAFEERVRVGGDNGLMSKGDNEARDCEVELQVPEAVVMGKMKLKRT